jgi:Secretion system C-terminal sorting domain
MLGLMETLAPFKTMKRQSCICFPVLFAGLASYGQNPSPDSVTDLAAGQHAGASTLFVNFTATPKEANRVFLQWDADSAAEGDYFVIERSPDETHYETIGVVRVTAGMEHYETVDGAAPNGSDFYRIKYTARTGAPVYSKTMQLSLSGAVDFKFYPNPVDKLFIVRTEHSMDLQVIDAAGIIRLSKRLQPGIQVVNVSTLEKGVYILRVTDKESNRAVSHQLLKN